MKMYIAAAVMALAIGFGVYTPHAGKNSPFVPERTLAGWDGPECRDGTERDCEHKETNKPARPRPYAAVKLRISHSIAAIAD